LLEILNATASIATAITKAKETINKTQTQNLDSTLSLINLEKSIRKQEQKTNQMIKSLHSQNTDQQKIST
jgi:transposase-like protein